MKNSIKLYKDEIISILIQVILLSITLSFSLYISPAKAITIARPVIARPVIARPAIINHQSVVTAPIVKPSSIHIVNYPWFIFWIPHSKCNQDDCKK